MEFKLVYIRRAKYLLLVCVYVLRCFSTIDSTCISISFFLFVPFPREKKKKCFRKKKIALMIVSILNEASR